MFWNRFSTFVSVLENTTSEIGGTPSFSTRVNVPVGSAHQSIVSADFNGDLRPDLVAATRYEYTLLVLMNTLPVIRDGQAIGTILPRSRERAVAGRRTSHSVGSDNSPISA